MSRLFPNAAPASSTPRGAPRRRDLVWLALMAGLGLAAPAASADSWPSKPVTIVVPFPAGGGTDAFAARSPPSSPSSWACR